MTADRVAVFLLAVLVHLATASVLVLGIALIVWGDTWLRILGCLAVLFWLGLRAGRPRFSRSGIAHQPLSVEGTPHLRSLVADVSGAVGVPPPTHLAVVPDFNAFVTLTGLTGRVLAIGAPLWDALTPQGRVFVLAHEMGHYRGRDPGRGRLVSSAKTMLRHWEDALDAGNGAETLGFLTTLLTYPIRLALRGYARLLTVLNRRPHREQEIDADLHGVVVAGRTGALEGLHTLLIADGITIALNSASMDGRRPDLATVVRTYTASVDDARFAALRDQSSSQPMEPDASHPPVHRRLEIVETMADAPELVTMDQERSALIDAELAGAFEWAYRRIGEDFRYRH